jgi:hypothetical protein
MRRRITDLFKKMFKGRKTVKAEPTTTEQPKQAGLFQPRKKPPSRWIIRHNQFQADRKRRAKNKVAKKSRQINRKAA